MPDQYAPNLAETFAGPDPAAVPAHLAAAAAGVGNAAIIAAHEASAAPADEQETINGDLAARVARLESVVAEHHHTLGRVHAFFATLKGKF